MRTHTIALIHRADLEGYCSAARPDERLLPEGFAIRIMDCCPDRAVVTVSDSPMDGAVRILNTADMGWREIVLDRDTMWRRCFYSPEYARSIDFQCWLHARHPMPPAAVALFEGVAKGAGELWISLEPHSDNHLSAGD